LGQARDLVKALVGIWQLSVTDGNVRFGQ
jgi:hypothetical protein